MENPLAIRHSQCTKRTSEAELQVVVPAIRFAKPRTKRFGGETPTDAMVSFCRGVGHGRAPQRRGAHLSAFHRGSRPKESFIARDSAPGFCFLGRGGKVGGPSVERALPASTCPSPARPSRPGRSARRITPKAARERVANPPAGTALARARLECLQVATESSDEIRKHM
jgi:hypothetical protein